jgi:PAS domain S-box-containing protein
LTAIALSSSGGAPGFDSNRDNAHATTTPAEPTQGQIKQPVSGQRPAPGSSNRTHRHGLAGWLLMGIGLSRIVAAGEVTSLSELYSLSRTQALEARPFHLTGTVLCYDSEWNQFFVHSAGAVTYFNPQGIRVPLVCGQSVEVTGITTWIEEHPALVNLTATPLGTVALPAPHRIELRQLAETAGQWIETDGQVRVAETSKGRLSLLLRAGAHTCIAYVTGALGTNDNAGLFGATVRVQAINTSSVTQGRLSSATLIVPALAQLKLVEPSTAVLAQVPVSSVETLLSRSLGPWTNDWVRLQASVLASKPQDYVVVKDPTGVIRARVIQATPIQAGTRVNVWGFLRVLAEEPVLEDAYFEEARSQASQTVRVSLGAGPQPARPAGGSVDLPRLLTRVTEVASLPVSDAAEALPVRLRGVLTYADPAWRTGFLQDETDAVFFELPQTNARSGDWVELTGVTSPGQFTPVVSNATLHVLGRTNLPAAASADLQDLADGHLDAHWVQLEGLVQRLAVEQGHLRLTLMTRQGRFTSVIPGFDQPPPTQLLDAWVRVQGVCGAEINRRNQLSGIVLHVPALGYVEELEAAQTDPFAVPVTAIGSVATFDPGHTRGHRIRLKGIVTLNLPGQFLFLQDASGGIRVKTIEPESVTPGDAVEVLGFPALGDFSPHLEQALLRKAEPGGWPQAIQTTAEQILLNGTNDAGLVQIEGTLLQEVPKSARPQLFLRDGPVIFTAQLANRFQAQQACGFRPGTRLALTGICSIQGTDRHEPQGLRLLLAGPRSLRMLSAPPVWTWRDTMVLAGSALLVAALVFGWVASLRREVRVRTQALAYERDLLSVLLENLPDAVYFKDRQSRFVRFSRFFGRLFNLSDAALLQGKTDFDFFTEEHARPAFEDEQEIMRSGVPIVGKVEKETHKDGRLTWCLTTKIPWRDNQGQVIGTFGVSKDITPIKEAELKVEGLHKQLLETSRQAGMAEVATSVLHNVGNVLNSLNVSTSLLLGIANRGKGSELSRLVELLREHHADLGDFLTHDPKGCQVPVYLEQLAAHLVRNQADLLAELDSVSKNVEHVKAIIAMQQNYARVAGVVETVPAADLVEDALRFNGGGLVRHQVEIVREYDPKVPVVTVDKHKVLQILVNLISNAKYACDNPRCPERRLTVSVNNGHGRVRICVADNGVGIAPENLTRIFNLGFTTRKNGHGFGLHNSALAARELGGSLTATSAGMGEGATFILELPVTPQSDPAP